MEGTETAKLLKEGEDTRLRSLGFYDFWTASGRDHCHSPLNSIKGTDHLQDPIKFVTGTRVSDSLLDSYTPKSTLGDKLRNPRTASMAKRGAIMRAEKVPLLQNLPHRSNHLQAIYNEKSNLSLPVNKDKTFSDAASIKQKRFVWV